MLADIDRDGLLDVVEGNYSDEINYLYRPRLYDTTRGAAGSLEIDAETAEVYYEINDNAASASAHGFVPTNGGRIIGPMGNLASMTVWGAAADTAVAHIQYFREG